MKNSLNWLDHSSS